MFRTVGDQPTLWDAILPEELAGCLPSWPGSTPYWTIGQRGSRG
jgi:hypothetical protein